MCAVLCRFRRNCRYSCFFLEFLIKIVLCRRNQRIPIYKMQQFFGKKFRISADFFKDHVPHTSCFFGFSLVQSLRFLHIKNGAGARIFKEDTPLDFCP